jgi:D-serine deaminase-like pyridoxal phosphate-dependent protein
MVFHATNVVDSTPGAPVLPGIRFAKASHATQTTTVVVCDSGYRGILREETAWQRSFGTGMVAPMVGSGEGLAVKQTQTCVRSQMEKVALNQVPGRFGHHEAPDRVPKLGTTVEACQ